MLDCLFPGGKQNTAVKSPVALSLLFKGTGLFFPGNIIQKTSILTWCVHNRTMHNRTMHNNNKPVKVWAQIGYQSCQRIMKEKHSLSYVLTSGAQYTRLQLWFFII